MKLFQTAFFSLTFCFLLSSCTKDSPGSSIDLAVILADSDLKNFKANTASMVYSLKTTSSSLGKSGQNLIPEEIVTEEDMENLGLAYGYADHQKFIEVLRTQSQLIASLEDKYSISSLDPQNLITLFEDTPFLPIKGQQGKSNCVSDVQICDGIAISEGVLITVGCAVGTAGFGSYICAAAGYAYTGFQLQACQNDFDDCVAAQEQEE